MPRRRFHAALISAGLLLAACAGGGDGAQRFPTSKDYPPTVMTRVAFEAGGGHGWKLSALETPNREQAAWKIVIITGTPSWSEYWAPTLAKVPADRTMIVADRPGFAQSEPRGVVTSIEAQADALAPMLDGPPGQQVVLIGQSYGGPIATVLAAKRPDKVKALVLMSAFFGERGPTIRRLSGLGSLTRIALPRDMKNSLDEINGQRKQMPSVREALAQIEAPILVLHGDQDTFVTLEAAKRLAETARADFMPVQGDHFLNACCVSDVLAAAERAIAAAAAKTTSRS